MIYLVAVIIVLLGTMLVWQYRRGQSSPREHVPGDETLSSVPFFAGLSREQRDLSKTLMTEVHAPKGYRVVREHAAGHALFIVVEGSVNILKRGTYDEILLRDVGPGEIIGEMALVIGASRVASAVTSSQAVFLKVEQAALEQLMATSPALTTSIWEACERHVLELAIADREQLRSMSQASRKAWIDARQSGFGEPGKLIPPNEAAFLGLIAGEIVHNGVSLVGPTLIGLQPGDDVRVTRRARIAWLPRSQKLAS